MFRHAAFPLHLHADKLAVYLVLLAACSMVLGCISRGERKQADQSLEVARFSAAKPGGRFSDGWRPAIFTRFKKATQYQLAAVGGTTVVAAHASSSASGLVHDVDIDVHRFPWLHWRWMVPATIREADSTLQSAEDSPARIVLGFAGEVMTLPFSDRLFLREFKVVTGAELPYATLMYIWENRLAVGTIIPNPHTPRVQMVVAQSGTASIGQWVEEDHNVLEDYRAAFGAEPGHVISIGIMTDSDNTGAVVDAYYGDILFARQPQR